MSAYSPKVTPIFMDFAFRILYFAFRIQYFALTTIREVFAFSRLPFREKVNFCIFAIVTSIFGGVGVPNGAGWRGVAVPNGAAVPSSRVAGGVAMPNGMAVPSARVAGGVAVPNGAAVPSAQVAGGVAVIGA